MTDGIRVADPPIPWEQYRKSRLHPVLIPFLFSEWLAQWAVFALSRWTLLQALEYAGNLSILVAIIFYFAETKDRTQARHYQAWQVINTAQGKGGSGGRIDAMKELNDDHVAMVGVDVSDAFLQGVELEFADIHRGIFRAADMRNARLMNANLELSEMTFANLRQADLRGANLTDVDLKDSDLNGAVLAGANLSRAIFDRADLGDVDLANVTGWDHISVVGTQIGGIRNPPAGFIAWALKHGALQQFATTTGP